jgi:hypothetical protein
MTFKQGITMLKNLFYLAFSLFLIAFTTGQAADTLQLRDQFKKAQVGDYIITAQGKNYTLLHIVKRSPQTLTIEEISVPAKNFGASFHSWKEWVKKGAPQHTSWSLYEVDLNSGQLIKNVSLSKNSSHNLSKTKSFLTTLLNLNFTAIPPRERRHTGVRKSLWHPRLVFEGQVIPQATFKAWKARWPKDGTELSTKMIEIYLPEKEGAYPLYFPYWLQTGGLISQAKIRIIDSGKGMVSPLALQRSP